MDELVSGSMARQRFPMLLLAAFAGLALALASVGTYGVISYGTARRVHEIGIRMALGAERRRISRMVVGNGFRLALAGIVIGTGAVAVIARAYPVFSQLLYGVAVLDPVTMAVASLILICSALAAAYVPARRAARIDPIVALRHE